jgi:hypothetical protein
MCLTKTSGIGKIDKMLHKGDFKNSDPNFSETAPYKRKKFYELMGHNNLSLLLKFYDYLMKRKNTGARARKIFNQQYLKNEPERWSFYFFNH